jgi:hypothetical protein
MTRGGAYRGASAHVVTWRECTWAASEIWPQFTIWICKPAMIIVRRVKPEMPRGDEGDDFMGCLNVIGPVESSAVLS